MAYFKYQCPNCLRTYDTTVGISECPQCNKQHDVTKDDMPKSGERNLVEGQSCSAQRKISRYAYW